MITVQDRIVVEASDLERLETMLHERYVAGAAARGLTLMASHISPPVATANHPLTLWLRWEVADVGAWWAMRAQSGTPEVAAFWQEVDTFCQSRERIYLTDQGATQIPQVDTGQAAPVTTRGYRETAQLALREDAGPEGGEALEQVLQRAAESLPGLEVSTLARNFAPEYAAGHFTWDLLFPDVATAELARASPFWTGKVAPALEKYCGAVHALALDTINAGLCAPNIANGVKRTAFFRLLPGVAADTAARFEGDLLEMPAHITEIRNWRLSRAEPAAWNRSDDAAWTYIWEQEFADLEGLTGPYMAHPHHWAHIDRWFDPESGDQAIDARLSHAFSPFGTSLLARELVPASRSE